MPANDHHHHDIETLGLALLTVSSTRDHTQDPSGDTAVTITEEAGHHVIHRDICRDEVVPIQRTVKRFVSDEAVDVAVTMGGTGVTPDDVTPEAVSALFDRRLPGFGERFRTRSVEDIGERVIASRATGGIVHGVPVFCVPGSKGAVRLAMAELILPISGHLVGLANRRHTEQ